jgi:twitching motility protein PilT
VLQIDITVEGEGRKRETFRFTKTPVTIGRHEQRDLRLDEPRVSRLHAEIRENGQQFELVVHSTNSPTELNGKLVKGTVKLPPRATIVLAAGLFKLGFKAMRDEWRSVISRKEGKPAAGVKPPAPRPAAKPAGRGPAPAAKPAGRRPRPQDEEPTEVPTGPRRPAKGQPKEQVAVPAAVAKTLDQQTGDGPAFVLVPMDQVGGAATKLTGKFKWDPRKVAEEEEGERLKQQDARVPSPAGERLDALLKMARGCGASDLHLVVGQPPILRVNGQLRHAEEGRLGAKDLVELLQGALGPNQHAEFTKAGDLDWCHLVGEERYRANACKERAGPALTFRVIHQTLPSLEELGLPASISRLVTYAQGLILVTGPLGAGKTTTLVSLVEMVNQSRPDHIITCEDPIEFLIPPAKSQVSQRALGEHTVSFANALRGALREEPDVLMIGDLRDYETASLAISASETGHLVLASMPAMSAVKTLDKLIDMFPADEQDATRGMVSESLRGVICQRLVEGTEGARQAAVELLFNSVAVGNIIRDGNSAKLVNAMQMARSQGMRTLEDSLKELLEAGRISQETFDLELGR